MMSRMVVRSLSTRGRVLMPHIDSRKIGAREVVGMGRSGQATYIDDPLYPYPAIRYRETIPIYKALKEKEKGDWRSLTIQEKKCLYRVSFCQTFAEFTAPTGEWKSIVGLSLVLVSLGIWVYLLQVAIAPVERPKSFDCDRREAQLVRMIGLRTNPIFGLASYWDYDKEDWKKNVKK